MATRTALRMVQIEGPRLVTLAQSVRGVPTPELGPPMWTLIAGAPHFGPQDRLPPRSTTEDNVHPVRTLMHDPTPSPVHVTSGDDSRELPLHVPRVLGVHLIVGSIGPYSWLDADGLLTPFTNERLIVRFAAEGSSELVVKNRRDPNRKRSFATVTYDEDLPFVHVAVDPDPRITSDSKWSWVDNSDNTEKNDILVPPLRLIEGSCIPLTVRKSALPWLGAMSPDDETFTIRLCADGIEITTRVSLPGLKGRLLEGVFLLSPRPPADLGTSGSALVLRLLPDRLSVEQRKSWAEAWNAVTPTETGERTFPGCRLLPRRGGLPPAFSWPLRFKDDEFAFPDPLEVEVPRTDAELVLVGSMGTNRNAPDGAASILADRTRMVAIATPGNAAVNQLKGWGFSTAPAMKILASINTAVTDRSAVAFVFDRRKRKDAPPPSWTARYTALVHDETTVDSAFKFGVDSEPAAAPSPAIPLVHDERRLAASLRAAYGLPEAAHQRIAAKAGVDPSTTAARDIDGDRPFVPGFVPIEGGWLQLPLPNLLPVDPSHDDALLGAFATAAPSAIDGYVRYSETAGVAQVSGYDDPGTAPPVIGASVPWSVTIESAADASGAYIIVSADTASMKPSSAHGTVVVLDDPELSCRGLLWLSADRPSAVEALPRLGAGPGSFLDLPFTTTKIVDDPSRVAQFFLSKLSFAVETQRANRGDVDLEMRWNKKARPLRADDPALPLLDQVKTAIHATQAVMTGVPSRGDDPSPLPAVAWVRHPTLPLATEMPMTRAVASAVPPLESRDLSPFRLELAVVKSDVFRLAALSWSASAVFASLSARAVALRIGGWPWPKNVAERHEGIAFTAFAVPGVEIEPLPDGAASAAWSAIRHAYRYDVPALDEAFATASLPATTDVPSGSDRDKAPVPPPATALDWVALKSFWDDQQRRHQLTRVVASYATWFDVSAPSKKLKIATVVGGLTWEVTTGFDPTFKHGSGTPASTLPYGGVRFALPGRSAVTAGDAALRGISGRFNVKATAELEWTEPETDPHGAAPAQIGMVGWSPSTYVTSDGYQNDNMRFGVKAPDAATSSTTLRMIHDGTRPCTLATANDSLSVHVAGEPRFGFWFKDVPLDGDTFTATSYLGTQAEEFTLFDAWTNEKLPVDGFEWRLYALDEPTIAGGRDLLPFFGFGLEPLRLRMLKLETGAASPTNGEVLEVELLARLTLKDSTGALEAADRPPPGGNLITLTLERSQHRALTLKAITPFKNAAHVFAIRTTDALSKKLRPSVLRGTPGLTAAKLMTFDNARIAFSYQGIAMDVSVTVTLPREMTGPVSAKSEPPVPTVPTVPAPGKGSLTVTDVKLSTSPGLTITVAACLEIQPMARGVKAERGAIRLEVAPGATTVSILGLRFTAADGTAFAEHDGALTLTFNGIAVTSPLCGGWPTTTQQVSGTIAVVLEASKTTGVDRALVARCGRVEAMVATTSAETAGFDIADVRIVVEAGRRLANGTRDDDWKGGLTVSGTISSESAILWPQVETLVPTIPNPEKASDNGRRTVRKKTQAESLRHMVSYRLDRHRLSFDRFDIAPDGSVTIARAWSILATARHTLTVGRSSEKSVSWSSIDTITIASAAVLFARPDRDETEPYAFAARYRKELTGTSAPEHDNPDILKPGLGRVRTVLEGSSGGPFRTAATAAPAVDGLVVAGGFLGILPGAPERARENASQRTTVRYDTAPLLRLPFLVRFTNGKLGPEGDWLAPGAITQSAIPDGIELAWADTGAARQLFTTARSLIAARGTDEAALLAALRTGALPSADATPIVGAVDAAVLVDQAFIRPRPGALHPDLATTPFWLGAAVTVSRVFETVATSRHVDDAVSIVAGSVVMKGGARRGVAALLRPNALPRLGDGTRRSPATSCPVPEPVLLSAGTVLVEEPWTGGSPEEAGTSALNGMASALAVRAHARPRLAVIRSRTTATTATPRVVYTAVRLPRAALSEMPAERVANDLPVFAEPGRGYPSAPGDGARRWLTAPLQGRVAAIRNEKPVAPMTAATGIAGLGHALALPAQAGKPVAIDSAGTAEHVGDGIVWLTEKRVPVYQPLPLTDVRSPAIPWLTTAPPRVRLPTNADVRTALLTASARQSTAAEPSATPPEAQPFLPPEASVVSVAERAGILTARRAVLLCALGVDGGDAFDAEHGRFGRPGQMGSSVARQIRTPRPGPLPPNTGDAARDRRPCASPLLPMVPARFVVGPADAVRSAGDDERPPWTAVVVAAPATDGVVTERWDGSVRLRVELDIWSVPADPSAAELPQKLARRLFPQGRDAKSLQAGASLIIGDIIFPFRSLQVLPSSAPTRIPGNGGEITRGTIDLVLDLRSPQEAGKGAKARADIAAALAAGGFVPTVDIRLTVHPAATHAFPAAFNPGAIFALAVPAPGTVVLPEGTTRPPVTLSMPLAVVSADRGALPLAPTTLVFMDAAYESGLSNPPGEDGGVVQLTPADGSTTALPTDRGAIRGVLSVDRSRANRRGTVAFMLDLRFERPPQSRVTKPALAPNLELDGDLVIANDPANPTVRSRPFQLKLAVTPKRGERRELRLGPTADAPTIALARMYELSLPTLREIDGTPANLAPGDVLEVTIFEPLRDPPTSRSKVAFWNVATANKTDDFQLPPGFSRTVRIVLTDEPVVEPPPALYAALALSRTADDRSSLSLPLYAQSPLPPRVDFRDLKADFRAGLVRRTATFAWRLMRPSSDLPPPIGTAPRFCAYVVKIDRNGQAHFPDGIDELVAPIRL